MSQRSKREVNPGKATAAQSTASVLSGTSHSPKSGCHPDSLNDRWLVTGACIFLAAIVWVVFGQTLHHEFVNFDDERYVYDNLLVQKGLTWEGFRWALTYGQIGHWHPLTWLSHMLDCQLYGLSPGGHHLTNVLLHTATVILLFLLLRRMTGFLWRSAFVAAVFAIHPLRAESVAWVAERKDVLSALFFMLTLGAYVRYVHRPSMIRYGAVVLILALGLLSKNMLVTTPFVLLLLDYWPLKRISDFRFPISDLKRLLAEKIPLFVLAIGSCVATALAPEKVATGSILSFPLRIENAVISYVIYLWQMIHPLGLACVYPNPTNYLPLWQVAGASGFLLAISGVAWTFRKTYPCLIVGWFWYLGMMIPVIGIAQISYYAHADRYTYLPQIGVYLLATWMAADLCAGWRHSRVVLSGCSAIVIGTLIFCARTQVSYWQNSELLWTHTLACTSGNFIAQNDLGNALLQEGDADGAMIHFQTAVQINPDYVEALNNVGSVLAQQGKLDEAIIYFQKVLQINPDSAGVQINLGKALLIKGRADEAMVHFQAALQSKPDSVEAHISLGNILLQQGRTDEAIAHYEKVLQINPDSAPVHFNLGNALLRKGRMEEAIGHFQAALQLKPNSAEAHISLGNVLLQMDRTDEAMVHYQKALDIKPDSPMVLNNLAWLLATSPDAHIRDGVLAVKYAERACELTHYGAAPLVGTLAAAYAEAGRYDDAVAAAQKACALATAEGKQGLLETTRNLLQLYLVHQPYHEADGRSVPAGP